MFQQTNLKHRSNSNFIEKINLQKMYGTNSTLKLSFNPNRIKYKKDNLKYFNPSVINIQSEYFIPG